MTDKELLSAAAIVAGAKWSDYPDRTPGCWTIQHGDGVWRPWNPLADTEDAMLLAVALRAAKGESWVICLSIGDNRTACEFQYASGGDALANTRRAIVMAAADYAAKIKKE